MFSMFFLKNENKTVHIIVAIIRALFSFGVFFGHCTLWLGTF